MLVEGHQLHTDVDEPFGGLWGDRGDELGPCAVVENDDVTALHCTAAASLDLGRADDGIVGGDPKAHHHRLAEEGARVELGQGVAVEVDVLRRKNMCAEGAGELDPADAGGCAAGVAGFKYLGAQAVLAAVGAEPAGGVDDVLWQWRSLLFGRRRGLLAPDPK